MKEGIKKFICVKILIVWGIIGLCGILAKGTFIKKIFEDRAAGEEFFLPGVLILVVAVLSLLAFSITCVILFHSKDKQNGNSL